MKLFIDDKRNLREVYPAAHLEEWVVVRTSDLAIKFIQDTGMPDFISFDHDLGLGEVQDAMKVVKWLREKVIDEELTIPDDFEYAVHSANPVGAMNLKCLMDNIIKYSRKQLRGQESG